MKIEITGLIHASGLRAFVNEEQLPEAVRQLVIEAQRGGLASHAITIQRLRDEGDFEVILWAD